VLKYLVPGSLHRADHPCITKVIEWRRDCMAIGPGQVTHSVHAGAQQWSIRKSVNKRVSII